MLEEVMNPLFLEINSLRATLQRPLPGEEAIVSRAALKGCEGRMRFAGCEFDTSDVRYF